MSNTNKEYLQVKTFEKFRLTKDNESALNKFLKEIGTRAVSVTPIWNRVESKIDYVVVYW